MVWVKSSRSVDRNTTISEHHTPGPITGGVKELTSLHDRKWRKVLPDCPEPSKAMKCCFNVLGVKVAP